MKILKYAWRVLVGLAYLTVVVGFVSAAQTRFQTLVLAGMVQIYAVLVFNFSLMGVGADVNNYAGFVRFRILANAQGAKGSEDGTFEEQENALAESIKDYTPAIWITRVFDAVVSIYALFKIIQAAFFT